MKVLSTGQAAAKLQTSHDTVLRLIQSGTLPATRLSEKGRWRIRQDDLTEYAQQHGLVLLDDDESISEK